jgi:hypothetical protein
MQGIEMTRKPTHPSSKKVVRVVAASGASRKLLIRRLREIDRLTAKELSILMADAEKIKEAFRHKRK